ncbi:MAG: hypothetical protein Q8M88_12445 [Phenylobacterium sp.]|uniref:hypothetical protein n=1 Tax=Phenylobacterium sp. TaxID=1871053 RepID=UPI00273505AC|nr:hypothetical protein [Phenylobacterium sp.]MDP3175232.1 hypothetical protein [Phenylobacterium sp.]
MFKPARRRTKAPAARPPVRLRPLSGAVIDAVLRYSDVQQDLGGGRTLMRISDARLHEAEVRDSLGDTAARAATVSILWNEREGQIIQVLDSARRLAA